MDSEEEDKAELVTQEVRSWCSFKVVEEVSAVGASLVTDCECEMSGCLGAMVLSLRLQWPVGETRQSDLISKLVDVIARGSQLCLNELGHHACPSRSPKAQPHKRMQVLLCYPTHRNEHVMPFHTDRKNRKTVRPS